MTERLRQQAVGLAAALALELSRTTRNRKALLLTFLMPAAIASIVVLALGSTDDTGPVEIGWIATADDASVDQFVGTVVGNEELADLIRWVPVDSVAHARAQVAAASLGAAIVVAPAPVVDGPAVLTVIADEDPIAGGVASTIVDEYRVGHAAAVVAFSQGVAMPARGEALHLEVVAPTGASLDAAVHWGPALGGFFVLLAMGHAAHRQVEDRHRGITGRLDSTITGSAAVVIGRSLAATAIGAAALLMMAATTRILFGRAWGPWPQIIAVAVATAVAIAGIGAVIASASNTPGRAQSLTAVTAFGLAILGGSFSPLGRAGAPRGLQQWLPTSLSTEAFGTVTTTGAWAQLVTPLLALAGIGVGLSALGTIASSRRWTR